MLIRIHADAPRSGSLKGRLKGSQAGAAGHREEYIRSISTVLLGTKLQHLGRIRPIPHPGGNNLYIRVISSGAFRISGDKVTDYRVLNAAHRTDDSVLAHGCRNHAYQIRTLILGICYV